MKNGESLPEGFNKWHSFNVTNGPSQFDDAYLWHGLVKTDRNGCHPFNPVLDCVGYMRYNLQLQNELLI